MERNMIHCGDAKALASSLDEGSVQAYITSPPYYEQRVYHIDGVLWGGDPGCQHEFVPDTLPKTKCAAETSDMTPGMLCKRCGGWFGVLGQESTPAAYIEHLVSVFEALRPALRDDGTLWIVIGDSYARSNMPGGIKGQDLILVPDMLRLALREAGWYIRATGPWIKPNAKPENVTNRPPVCHESVILCAKNAGNPLYWTHEDKNGTRRKPSPEHFWLKRRGKGRRETRPDDPSTWIKKSRWTGHSYYYDPDSVRIPYLTPLGRWSGDYYESTGRETGGKETGHRLDRDRNLRPDPAGRLFRTTDFWMETMAALVSNGYFGFYENAYSFQGAHFATFPPAMIAKMIQMCSPSTCCAECGAPFAKATVYTGKLIENIRWGQGASFLEDQGMRGGDGVFATGTIREKNPTEPRPTCDCNCNAEKGRSLIVDPFMGSGTVGAIAALLGRDYIGFEANSDYVEIAEKRIRELFASPVAGRILEDQCQPRLL